MVARKGRTSRPGGKGSAGKKGQGGEERAGRGRKGRAGKKGQEREERAERGDGREAGRRAEVAEWNDHKRDGGDGVPRRRADLRALPALPRVARATARAPRVCGARCARRDPRPPPRACRAWASRTGG